MVTTRIRGYAPSSQVRDTARIPIAEDAEAEVIVSTFRGKQVHTLNEHSIPLFVDYSQL